MRAQSILTLSPSLTISTRFLSLFVTVAAYARLFGACKRRFLFVQ